MLQSQLQFWNTTRRNQIAGLANYNKEDEIVLTKENWIKPRDRYQIVIKSIFV